MRQPKMRPTEDFYKAGLELLIDCLIKRIYIKNEMFTPYDLYRIKIYLIKHYGVCDPIRQWKRLNRLLRALHKNS